MNSFYEALLQGALSRIEEALRAAEERERERQADWFHWIETQSKDASRR